MKKTLLTGLSCLALISASNAAVTLTLSGTAGSTTLNYILTGTGTFTSTANSSTQVNVDTAEFYSHASSFFGVAETYTVTPDTATGLTNDNSASNVSLVSIGLIAGPANPLDTGFQLNFSGNTPINVGNTYTVTGSGTISLAEGNMPLINDSATFSNLTVGTYAAASDPFGGLSIVIENAAVAPEPSSTLLIALGGLGLLGRRRRA